MHNQITGTTGIDQESHIAHSSNTYGDNSWVDMNAYHQHQPAMATTMADYGTGFAYMPPISHGLPSESIGRMPPPPPPQPMAQPQATHPQLPMLIMPSHATWPSMLTNPTSYGSHSAPALPMPPVTLPLKTSKLPSIHAPSQPRKTLTDDDRRRMCQYAEDHPTVKQTEIGAMFGVERSTVSKVLRNKEKYLFPEDRSSSPIKRNKGKGVDIEKALTNYIRNAQKSGIALTDAEIKDKARLFSATMGNSSESHIKANSSTWLEKFKLKNGIGPGKLMRRASETNIPDSIHGSPSLTSSQPSSAISPASPSAQASPLPLSSTRSEDDKEANFMDFATEPSGYKHSNAQSTTSLSSAFTDSAATSSFSGSAISPTGPFSFSPDPNIGGFLAADQNRAGGPASNFQRPRSQTFPTLDLEYMNQQMANATEPLTPKYHVSSTAPSSALESPGNEATAPHFAVDQALTASPQLRHSSSTSSLAAGRGAAASPISPTQEDARRAADTLLTFIQNAAGAFVDQNEYLTVVRLTERLRLQQMAVGSKGTAGQGMGGLSRIPEGDSEMSNAPTMKMEPTTLGA